jgi:hypothetical protein
MLHGCDWAGRATSVWRASRSGSDVHLHHSLTCICGGSTRNHNECGLHGVLASSCTTCVNNEQLKLPASVYLLWRASAAAPLVLVRNLAVRPQLRPLQGKCWVGVWKQRCGACCSAVYTLGYAISAIQCHLAMGGPSCPLACGNKPGAIMRHDIICL